MFHSHALVDVFRKQAKPLCNYSISYSKYLEHFLGRHFCQCRYRSDVTQLDYRLKWT